MEGQAMRCPSRIRSGGIGARLAPDASGAARDRLRGSFEQRSFGGGKALELAVEGFIGCAKGIQE